MLDGTSLEETEQELKQRFIEIYRHIKDKLIKQQGQATQLDKTLYRLLNWTIGENPLQPKTDLKHKLSSPNGKFLLNWSSRLRQGRFVNLFERYTLDTFEIPLIFFLMSQGSSAPLSWCNRLMLKTCFDLTIYQMLLSEIRPRTVIELGSGTGGSAMWIADMLSVLGIDSHVYSMDIQPPEISDSSVTFFYGDCHRISQAWIPFIKKGLPKPWLVIEDAHQNIQGILEFFDEHLTADDYLVIEDSASKKMKISDFVKPKQAKYLVDTRYTDLLGFNATSCIDSIFKCF